MNGAHFKASLRKSPASKCVALGFAAAILLGNFWIGYAALGIPIPGWLTHGLSYTGVFLGVVILWFLVTAVYLGFAVPNPPEAPEEPNEADVEL